MQRDPEALLREIESGVRSQGPAEKRIERLLPEATNADPRAALVIGAVLAALAVVSLAA